MNKPLAISKLVEFVDSICDNDMLESHDLTRALEFLKEGFKLPQCANCETPLDNDQPFYEVSLLDGETGVICTSCEQNNSFEDLEEKGITVS